MKNTDCQPLFDKASKVVIDGLFHLHPDQINVIVDLITILNHHKDDRSMTIPHILYRIADLYGTRTVGPLKQLTNRRLAIYTNKYIEMLASEIRKAQNDKSKPTTE